MELTKKKIVLLCVFVFFSGFVLFFPLQNFKGILFKSIFEQTGIIIVAEEIQPIFLGWPGVRLKRANVSIPLGASDFELSSKTLDIRFRLTSSLVPSASLYFDELSGGGSLFLRAGTRGDRLLVALKSRDLSLAGIPVPGIDQSLGGVIQSDVSIKYDDARFSETEGSVFVQGKNFKTPPILVNNPLLGPPFQIPELEMGPINIDMEIKNGAWTVKKFELGNNSSDLKAVITASAKLGNTPMETQLNLVLKLTFSEKIFANPEYKTFLDFLGAYQGSSAGEYGLGWNATIQEIANLTKALPSPVK